VVGKGNAIECWYGRSQSRKARVVQAGARKSFMFVDPMAEGDFTYCGHGSDGSVQRASSRAHGPSQPSP